MKTTAKHFELFKKECFKWQKFFNLQGIELYFKHEELDDGVCASTLYSHDAHIANLTFSTEYPVDTARELTKDIKHTALHEILHVVTGDLVELGRTRHASEEAYDKAMEALVCNLTSAFDRMLPKRIKS